MHINVSRGAKPVPVPDVTGQPYANAKSALEGQGFSRRARRHPVRPGRKGVVVAEDPPPGTSVSKGAKITLSVSKGPATTQVPDVTGQNQADAEAILTGAGLTADGDLRPGHRPEPGRDRQSRRTRPPARDAKTGEVVTIHVGQLRGRPAATATTTTTTTTP